MNIFFYPLNLEVMLKPTKAKNRELAFCVPWVPDAEKEKKVSWLRNFICI